MVNNDDEKDVPSSQAAYKKIMGMIIRSPATCGGTYLIMGKPTKKSCGLWMIIRLLASCGSAYLIMGKRRRIRIMMMIKEMISS